VNVGIEKNRLCSPPEAHLTSEVSQSEEKLSPFAMVKKPDGTNDRSFGFCVRCSKVLGVGA